MSHLKPSVVRGMRDLATLRASDADHVKSESSRQLRLPSRKRKCQVYHYVARPMILLFVKSILSWLHCRLGEFGFCYGQREAGGEHAISRLICPLLAATTIGQYHCFHMFCVHYLVVVALLDLRCRYIIDDVILHATAQQSQSIEGKCATELWRTTVSKSRNLKKMCLST